MYYVSILVPAFAFRNDCDVRKEISHHFNISPEAVQVVAIKPEAEEYAVKLPHLDFNLERLEQLMGDNDRLKREVHRLKNQIVELGKTIVPASYQAAPAELRRQLKQTKQLLDFYVSTVRRIRTQSQATIDGILQELSLLEKERRPSVSSN